MTEAELKKIAERATLAQSETAKDMAAVLRDDVPELIAEIWLCWAKLEEAKHAAWERSERD